MIVTLLVLTLASAEAQGTRDAASAWNPPRTPDGQPDVQGLWDAEAVGIEVQQDIENGSDPVHSTMLRQKILPSRVIVDPPDGRIPYQPWAAAKKLENFNNRYSPNRRLRDPIASCRMTGVPRMNYQGGIRIHQVPGFVVFVLDAYHTARIVPLDARPRLSSDVKLWMGDSRGRWEGATLVIDSTNYNDRTWFDWAGNFHSDALHVTERWTFVDAGTARYEATLEDAKVYTRPWKIAMNFRKQQYQEPWEEACYEGIPSHDRELPK
jgi:hypothetical protein